LISSNDEAPMRILHVTPFFAPAWAYGGLPEAAYQLARHESCAGVAVRVLTTNANGWGKRLDAAAIAQYARRDGIDVRYCARVARQSVSLELLGALAEQVRWADVVHLHAAYSFPTIPTLIASRMLKRPVVWTPHGAFQRWSGSRRVGLKSLWERVCLAIGSDSVVYHLTSDAEVDETRARFLRAAIARIANGVEVPPTVNRTTCDAGLRLGFVGRIDPKKGIENLLAACRIVKERGALEFLLTIAGAGSPDYEAKLRDEITRLELSDKVTMLGDVRGDEKRRMFEMIDVAVVPSFTENFGIVVAEALAHSVAVIASTGTPWKDVEQRGCGLWVDNDPTSLADAIVKINSMSVVEMGRCGRRWMAADYSWESAASEMITLYQRMLPRTARESHSGPSDLGLSIHKC
jgi:glycosyltransferase involved in cell wall biosynthesis